MLLNTSPGSNNWLEAGEITGDIFLDMYNAPRGFRSMMRAQAAFIEDQDQLTGRARHMFRSLGRDITTISKSVVAKTGCQLTSYRVKNTQQWTLPLATDDTDTA